MVQETSTRSLSGNKQAGMLNKHTKLIVRVPPVLLWRLAGRLRWLSEAQGLLMMSHIYR